MKQLNSLDAAFLYLETPNTPMHFGAIHIFSAPDKKSASFESFQSRLAERIHQAPILMQKLMRIPFNLDAPFLVDDPDFALSLHVSHVGLPHPGDHKSLYELSASIQRKPLDQHKALWELTFVDQLDGLSLPGKYSFAIINKIHHTIVDGISGEALLSKLLDFSQEPNTKSKPNLKLKTKLPSAVQLLVKSYTQALRNPKKIIEMAANASSTGAKILAQKTAGDLKKLITFKRAPATVFERELSDDRVIGSLEIPLAKLKRCRKLYPSATTNDMMLGVIATGLSNYLASHDNLPADNLMALVPVSIRRNNMEQPPSRQGANQITGMLVELPTSRKHEPDIGTLDRIALISQSTRKSKALSRATKISQLTEFFPSIYLSIAAKLYTRWTISKHHQPLFNLVITNVPGPQIPLYMRKAKLIEQYGLAPIFTGMGLSIVLLSYNGQLSVTVNSCHSIIPDMDQFIAALQKAFEELISQGDTKKPINIPKKVTKKLPQAQRQAN